MLRTAVFVDAGYLHAQGSALLSGQKKPRNQIILDVERTLEHLKTYHASCAPDERLLRIYWYDGLQRSGRLSAEQEQIAGAQFTKLRLGVVNSQGDQKGVDSLIVTDLIDLARNRAIASAILMSGDEDIRIGVQIAQTFGVQIHLLGIKPARGSQSPDLIREADTHHEWDETILRDIMVLRESADGTATSSLDPSAIPGTAVDPEHLDFASLVRRAINDTLDALDQQILDHNLRAFRANPANVPQDMDRPTLARMRSLLGRDLSDEERKAYRNLFRSELGQL